jgi:hypothetical protein
MRRNGKLLVGVLSLVAVLIGCSEHATPTEAPVAEAPSYGRAVAPKENGPKASGVVDPANDVLQRGKALGQVSTSRVIGPEGGVLELSEAGLRVVFSPGAVPAPVTISVTTHGSGIAYEFQPHGIRFQAPVMVEQDLRSTGVVRNAKLLHPVKAAYFEGHLDDGSARITEYRPSVVNLGQQKVSFTIEHFSGYLISVGRRGK